MNWTDHLIRRGWIPDGVIRFQIKRLLRLRLRDEYAGGAESVHDRFRARLALWSQGPIAINMQEANDQHYEVPPAFFQKVLGPNLKYSCCWFDNPQQSLEAAERGMLQLTCERADLRNGQTILELGCGWGSLSLWMAEHFPESQITAVSNSKDQRLYIESQAQTRGLSNLTIVTQDMNAFETDKIFDRVVSVEMFEHMRNHQALISKISKWLKPQGKLFVHIFTHRELTYPFEVKDETDWMAQYFFTGGMMPSDHYLLRFQESLKIEDHWRVNGLHYAYTSEAWLQNLDAHYDSLKNLFAASMTIPEAELQLARWRIFFMSCAELWKYKQGEEWIVSHYRFQRPI